MIEFDRSRLENGTVVFKYPQKASKKPQKRFIFVEFYPLQLVYESEQRKGSKVVDLHFVKEVRRGQNTKAFELQGKNPSLEQMSFSIIHTVNGEYKFLDLVAESVQECEFWADSIEKLALNSKEMMQSNETNLLKEMWDQVKRKNSFEIDLDGITNLLRKLNISLSKSEVKSALKNMAIPQKTLSFAGFIKYYNSLKSRQEILQIYNSLATENGIEFDKFRDFVTQEQKMDWSLDQIKDYYQKYSPDSLMNLVHFSAFLMSANNSIKKHKQINQRMDLSLENYFICSSHNTYLLGDQLTGKSSVEGYIRALQRGCKCVELDCWDGPNGQPIVYHGMTLTSKLLFRDVVEAIQKYAFVVSDFPVILSLETHCSVEQQELMAATLVQTFGDSLVSLALSDSKYLPSPIDLSNKILLKAKITKEDDDDEEEEGSRPKPERKSSTDSRKSIKKQTIHKALADLVVYLKAKTFPGFSSAQTQFSPVNMCSFSEKKAQLFYQKNQSEFKTHCSLFMTRIYPTLTRVSSSNFDPIPFWNVGAQLVAFNFQTFDKGMQLNDALFSLNGGCGYVLKQALECKSIDLQVKIISAQQLLVKKKSLVLANEQMEPFVEVEIVGLDNDNCKYRTRSVLENGVNPIWNESFSFQISNAHLAFLRLVVNDSSDFVGCYTIPVLGLAQGYRHAPLFDSRGELMKFSTVFMYIKSD